MARHIDEVAVTRDKLIHRLANARGLTYGRALDSASHLSLETLRDHVETMETLTDRPHGQRRRWAASQASTSLDGMTTALRGTTR